MSGLLRNCESIDASVFSSDMLFDDERRAELKAYIGRVVFEGEPGFEVAP